MRACCYVRLRFDTPSAPAQMLGLSRKGRLQVGLDADITVFDPSATTAMSGIRHVVVNGYVHNRAQQRTACPNTRT